LRWGYVDVVEFPVGLRLQHAKGVPATNLGLGRKSAVGQVVLYGLNRGAVEVGETNERGATAEGLNADGTRPTEEIPPLGAGDITSEDIEERFLDAICYRARSVPSHGSELATFRFPGNDPETHAITPIPILQETGSRRLVWQR